jgi:hypothetical protein
MESMIKFFEDLFMLFFIRKLALKGIECQNNNPQTK